MSIDKPNMTQISLLELDIGPKTQIQDGGCRNPEFPKNAIFCRVWLLYGNIYTQKLTFTQQSSLATEIRPKNQLQMAAAATLNFTKKCDFGHLFALV